MVVGAAASPGASSISLASVPTANHTSPLPWPLTSPGTASPAKVYSGNFPATSCSVPSSRIAVLNTPLSRPGPTVQSGSTSTGGHASAHVP